MALLASLLRSEKRPVFLELRSSAGLIVTTASFATFTDVFLYAVIVPVLPFSLSSRAGVAEDQVQYWISISLAVYGAALLASSPIWGYLADRIRNRKIPMLVGLIFLTGSTVFLCLATNIAMLLVGRVLQGCSAALTWTVGLALVVDSVDASQLGMATGWVGMATSLGVLLAPLLGGLVYEHGGYYSVFAMCFGILAVDIALRIAIIEVKEAKRWIDKTPVQSTTEMSGAIEDVVTKSEPTGDDAVQRVGKDNTMTEMSEEATPNHSQPSPASKHNHVIGPLIGLLRKPRLLAALWGTLVHAIIQTSFDSTLPLFVKSTFHWDSTGAGLAFLPLVAPCFISPLIGIMNDKYGPKWLATSGFIIATPFLICLRFVSEDSLNHKIMMCGLLVGVGLAVALVFGPLMAEISWSAVDGMDPTQDDMSAVPYAQAYGLYNMAFSGGCMLGPILGGLIRDRAGWPTVCWVLGLITAASTITQALWIGGPLKLKLPGRAGESS
ncbi:unnamed protein product [Clonostachys rosea f. rosea IK726]|uniref:Major facilitator superfamily (MFS) profile domain-containing protein n=2 Tax=Bionectria ochroleuca TaxID=29856 RepID=A0A0B7K140_BIOOC|nr:unnamed protein product [Clonostachys rosea f. rosea IK726]